MRKLLLLGLILVVTFAVACDDKPAGSKTEKPERVGSFPAGDDIPEDLIIRLNRTVCYGQCPGYLLTVKADGRVDFYGQDKTATKGQADGTVTKDQLRQLINAFKKANFFDLKDSYTTEDCATDNPRVRTTLFMNDRVKKVDHDKGCKAPKALTELEDKIDEIVGTQKWIGSPGKEK